MSCSLADLGYELRVNVVPESAIEGLRREFHATLPGERKFDARGAISAIAHGSLRVIAQEYLGASARPVRLILFNKSSEANWNLGWHQDRIIAVREKFDIRGFKNWSRKRGVLHVEPPFEYIERMITIRLHCDECRAENGALEVLPGSHRLGDLSDVETAQAVRRAHAKVLECSAGDAFVLSTAIVHRSILASSPRHRRIVHVDFSADQLPTPMNWAFSL